MFCKKSERKRLPIAATLTVGALCAVGVICITKKSKSMCKCVTSKIRRMMGMGSECDSDGAKKEC